MTDSPAPPEPALALASAATLTRRAFLRAGAALLVTAAAGYGYYRWTLIPPDHDAARMTPDRALEAMAQGRMTLIDIRRPDEWQRTGLAPGAEPLDMRRDDFLTQVDRLTGGDRTVPLGLICARGVRSAQMTLHLTRAGYTNLVDIPEGMEGSAAGPGWVNRDLPVVAWSGR
ncbi:rhodanese-like domain-containing protein [Chachezhania sediminis]|uniref:rhodanese-like domain-containing protein n=1 Tax=Chachezhania sediminis TaxID=2599291 RepID=UPI00131EAF79|nr:rhodanese-like domain-containing protein [Chachezhania sediminis]